MQAHKLCSTPDAAQRDWLDIDSCAREHDRPRVPLPREVDGATRVVRLAEILSPDDLRDDVFYQETVEDITGEVRKFGHLLEVVIPRPGDPAAASGGGGVGKVFLKYACLDDSINSITELDGRWYSKRRVVAEFYPEDRFAAGDYGYDGSSNTSTSYMLCDLHS